MPPHVTQGPSNKAFEGVSGHGLVLLLIARSRDFTFYRAVTQDPSMPLDDPILRRFGPG